MSALHQSRQTNHPSSTIGDHTESMKAGKIRAT